jgi:hypothetical protein
MSATFCPVSASIDRYLRDIDEAWAEEQEVPDYVRARCGGCGKFFRAGLTSYLSLARETKCDCCKGEK